MNAALLLERALAVVLKSRPAQSELQARGGWARQFFKKGPGPIRSCRAQDERKLLDLFSLFLLYDVAQKPCRNFLLVRASAIVP